MHPVRSYPGRPVVLCFVMATSLAVLLGKVSESLLQGSYSSVSLLIFFLMYPLSLSLCFFVLLINLFPNQNSVGHYHFPILFNVSEEECTQKAINWKLNTQAEGYVHHEVSCRQFRSLEDWGRATHTYWAFDLSLNRDLFSYKAFFRNFGSESPRQNL